MCVNGDRIDEALFDACPQLRLVAMASTGYDSVDVPPPTDAAWQ